MYIDLWVNRMQPIIEEEIFTYTLTQKYDLISKFIENAGIEYKKKIISFEIEQRQAEAFLKQYDKTLEKNCKNIINEFMLLGKSPSFKNKYLIIKNCYFKSGFWRNVGMLIKA